MTPLHKLACIRTLTFVKLHKLHIYMYDYGKLAVIVNLWGRFLSLKAPDLELLLHGSTSRRINFIFEFFWRTKSVLHFLIPFSE